MFFFKIGDVGKHIFLNIYCEEYNFKMKNLIIVLSIKCFSKRIYWNLCLIIALNLHWLKIKVT